MKKIIILAILAAFWNFKSEAQCLQFELAEATLSTSLPTFNTDSTAYIFNYRVITKIKNVYTGAFWQVDNSTFSIPFAQLNPFTINAVMADSAKAYILRTYPDK